MYTLVFRLNNEERGAQHDPTCQGSYLQPDNQPCLYLSVLCVLGWSLVVEYVADVPEV